MPIDRNARLTEHFAVLEAFPVSVNLSRLAVDPDTALEAARYLATAVLEPVRAMVASPIGVNSWARDLDRNAALATDPASKARVEDTARVPPHCTGESADIRVLEYDKQPEPARSNLYRALVVAVHKSALPIRRVILELTKPDDNSAFGRGRTQRVTHIHIQATKGRASRVFVVRDWIKNRDGVWCEHYRDWTPEVDGPAS